MEQVLQFTDGFVSRLWDEDQGEGGAQDAADAGDEENSTEIHNFHQVGERLKVIGKQLVISHTPRSLSST